ncbi:MAG: T9SS type A sorting domain-containing protein, partial [Bacteroidota bacterium]
QQARAALRKALVDLGEPTVGVEATGTQSPAAFALHQNFPNPFNPSTEIRFDVPLQSHVTLSVFNLLGQEVARLVDEDRSSGAYNQRWDASAFASGVYFYRLSAVPVARRDLVPRERDGQAGDFTASRKLLILR